MAEGNIVQEQESSFFTRTRENYKTEKLEISKDRLELRIRQWFEKLSLKVYWTAPAGIAFSCLITLATATEFRSLLSIDGEIWHAMIGIAGFISAVVAIYFGYDAYKNRNHSTVKYLVESIMKSEEQESTKNDQRQINNAILLSDDSALKIIKAIYGNGKSDFEVTMHLNNLIKDNQLRFIADNRIAGDPAPNIRKRISIEYRINGNRETVEFPENSNIIIDESGARLFIK